MIKDFSKISQSPSPLLLKVVEFNWINAYQKAFEKLKLLLTLAPIVRPLDWAPPFEIMYHVSDYALGVVLGQRKEFKSNVIYYANKT